jgi:outer membrane protein assembly factor BamD
MVGIKTHFMAWFIVLIIALGWGCASSIKREEIIDGEFYFARGMKMMKKKDYTKAIADFQVVVESYRGSAVVDSAQYMLGESHFMVEEYVTAAFEFERVYIDFPSSSLAPQAQYKKALCYYMESPKASLDQENTRLAINEFNRFIDNYPQHELVKEAQKKINELTEKLAYKEYLNAELYRVSKHLDGNLDAALIYYRLVIKEFPNTVWADYARFGIGQVYLERKEYDNARETFLLLVNSDVDRDLKVKSSKLLEKIDAIKKK